MDSNSGDWKSYIGDGDLNIIGLERLENLRVMSSLNNVLSLLEQELLIVASDNNIDEIVDVKLSLVDKEIGIHMEKIYKYVYIIVNNLKRFRKEQNMNNIMVQVNYIKIKLDQHSKSPSLHSKMLKKLYLISQSLVNMIIEMQMENENNFDILNSKGQKYNNNNSKQGNDSNQFSTNIK